MEKIYAEIIDNSPQSCNMICTPVALHSESVLLIGLCLVFQTIYFRQFLISGFKMNFPVKPEIGIFINL